MSQPNNHNKDKQIVKGFLYVAIVEGIIAKKIPFASKYNLKHRVKIKINKGKVMIKIMRIAINKKNFGRVMFKFLLIMSYIETFERVCRLICKFYRWL